MKKKISNNQSVSVQSDQEKKWSLFVQAVVKDVDPLLYSILSVSDLVTYDSVKNIVTISVYKKFVMFEDVFVENKKLYQKTLEQIFGFGTLLYVTFDKVEQKKVVPQNKATVVHKQPVQNYTSSKKYSSGYSANRITLPDDGTFELAHALLKHFGGTISECIKDIHEPDA